MIPNDEAMNVAVAREEYRARFWLSATLAYSAACCLWFLASHIC